MLKNLASLGTAGAVQSGASRMILEMRPRTMSCPKSLMHTLSNAPFSLRSAPPDRNNKYGIDNRRHCMGPSVDLFEPESHIRRLRFTGKCPRLTVDKNISNPSIAQSSHLEIRPSRPASCPQKLMSHITSLKLPSVNGEKLYSKDSLVSSLLKSKLSNGYANTAKTERSASEAPKTFSTSMSSRPTSKSAERGSLNRFSFQNILKPKEPISSTPRLFNINQSSSHIKKPTLKINKDNEKPEEKGLNWHFGSHRRVSSFERKNGEIYKIPDFADKGKVSLSNIKRPQTVNSRNLPKAFSVQSEIRTLSNKISSLSRLQQSSDNILVPCWGATNSSNVANANRLARPSRSVTGASSGLWSDKTLQKSARSTPSHPFETESTPNVFDKKIFSRYTSMNKVDTNTDKSELITLLEPQSISKGWRGNTKTRIEKLPFKKPKPQHDLESSNVKSQVARPHTSPKFHVFTRTESNKLHPGTMNANKQIAMIYKDKFDPALLDRFRYRNVTSNKYSKPSNCKTMTPQDSSNSRTTTSTFVKNSSLAKKQSFTSSAVVKALEIRNNLNFMKKAPTFSPGVRRDSFVVRPVTTTRHAQSTSSWVPFIRPPLVSTKPKTDKGFQNPESRDNIDKSASILNKRPLRQWKEKAEKWTDSVSRRPERELSGRYDKHSMSSFKRKASEKFEAANTTRTDKGVGSRVGGSRDGRKGFTLTEKASTSLRNVASQVWSSWHGLQRKIESGYVIALRATAPMLRIPPMLPDHLRFGLSKDD